MLIFRWLKMGKGGTKKGEGTEAEEKGQEKGQEQGTKADESRAAGSNQIVDIGEAKEASGADGADGAGGADGGAPGTEEEESCTAVITMRPATEESELDGDGGGGGGVGGGE